MCANRKFAESDFAARCTRCCCQCLSEAAGLNPWCREVVKQAREQIASRNPNAFKEKIEVRTCQRGLSGLQLSTSRALGRTASQTGHGNVFIPVRVLLIASCCRKRGDVVWCAVGGTGNAPALTHSRSSHASGLP